MRRLAALLTALALLAVPVVTPAAAISVETGFPTVYTYKEGTYSDVPGDKWFAPAVKVCFETGLMNGMGDGTFAPAGTVTVAQAVTLAARILSAASGIAIPAGYDGAPWYQPYAAYLTAYSVPYPSGSLEREATRLEFARLITAVTPADDIPPLNGITQLPDCDDADVITLYRAGILTGNDAYGTFAPQSTLLRQECAAILARLVRPDERKFFTLKTDPGAGSSAGSGGSSSGSGSSGSGASGSGSSSGVTGDEIALLVNGVAVSLSEYVGWLDRAVYQTDYDLYTNYGQRLDWTADYGVDDLPGYFKDQATQAAVRYRVQAIQAAAYGCEVDALAATLTPNPSQEVLSAYAESQDLLAAKHILVSSADVAQTIINAIQQQPTAEQFDSLMSFYSTDPGSATYPEGYLFTAGEMVSEFESAVRELSVGAFTTTPVASQFGYHVILRLDPAQLTETAQRYREAILNTLIATWVQEATVTVNEALLDRIDVKGCYEEYLKLLSAS